jgi:integrase
MVDGPRLEIAKQSRNYRLYLFAIHTGMRQGEILGLRWPDINFDNNIVSVQWKLSKPGLNPVFEPVKTQKSTRPIRLSETLKAELKKHQKEQVVEKAAMGDKYEDHNLVFCQTNGRPIDGTALTYKESSQTFKEAQ